MNTIIQFYSLANVDDRVEREGEKKINNQTLEHVHNNST